MEKELFVRLALCINPQKAAAAGIAKRALLSFGVGASGLSEEERRHREALKQKVLAEARLYSSDDQPHILPGLGPHPEAPAAKQLQIDIPADMMTSVAKKIVRGCEFWLANGRIIEPPYEIELFFVHAPDLPHNLAKMLALLGPVYLGPGLRIRRAVASDDQIAVVCEIVVWDSLPIYATILPPEQAAKAH